MNHIDVYRTHIAISPYNEENRNEHLEKSLSYYNKDYYRYEPIGYSYDEENQRLLIPRSVSLSKLEGIFECPANIIREHDDRDKVIIKLNCEPRDDKQREAIAFLLSKQKHDNLKNYSRRMLELDTGIGKTYCTIAAIAYMKEKGAIILHSKRLIEQWKEKIQEYTNLTDKELFVVSGSAKVERVLAGKCKKIKIFLISHDTISAYAKKHSWNDISELFRCMRVGVKVFDEAHLQFANTVKIDLYTNTKDTFYLTATAKRSNHMEHQLYARVFGPVPILSIKRQRDETYVNSCVLVYKSDPTLTELGLMKNTHGMNVNKYIDYMIYGRAREKFLKCISTILNTVVHRDGKVVLLVGRRKAAKDLKETVAEMFPEYSDDIGIFTSDIKGDDNRANELSKKIILSTFKSFGTGLDFNDELKAIIMCEPYSSTVTLDQCLGRLRHIEGEQLYYFELVDAGVPQRLKQFDKIKKELLKISSKVTTFKIP